MTTHMRNPFFAHANTALIVLPEDLLALTEARQWVLSFTRWYNQEHRHSGLNFLTPNQRHNGLSTQILEQRTQVYEEAKLLHPERWSGPIRDWTVDEIDWLNPERAEEAESKEKCFT